MSDNLLTALLDESAPRTTRTAAAHEHVRSLSAALEAAPRSRAWSVRVLAPVVAGVLVLGGASAAVASPTVMRWLDFPPTVTFPWSPNGRDPAASCTAAVGVVAGSTTTSAAAESALEAAKDYLATLNFAGIEKTPAYEAAYSSAVVNGGGTPAEKQLVRERFALTQVTGDLVRVELEKEGLDPTFVGLRASDSCAATN